MTVGVISDTHGILEPKVLRIFGGVALILHGGDIGTPAVLRALEAVAPVRAVLGNVDDARAVGRHPAARVEMVEGVRVYMTHQIGAPDGLLPPVARAVAGAQARVLVFGHTHRAYNAEHDGVLFLNPGGAGPRRFGLPRSVALLRVLGGAPKAEIIALDELGT
ncbi:MAG TPA: metallophosphoesterase family protein [Candidatus Methylomirabilis sp.]